MQIMIRILVVDDDLNICNLLNEFLINLGYDVRVTKDGISAIETFRQFSPHIILLDVILPDMNGVEILRKIREYDKHVRISMISGMHDLRVAKDAIQLGAVDYISKPFELDYIEEYIKGEVKEVLGTD